MADRKGKAQTEKAILAAIAANTIFGFSFMATRIAIGQTAPAILLSLRFIISFLIMLILVLIGIGKVSLKGKPIGMFILMGLCEPVIYFIAETNGIKYTTSSFSGVLISLIPVVTAVLSHVFIHEKLSARRLCWILFSVAGVVLISVSQTSEGVVTIRGIVYLLVAVISAAFHSVLSRSIADKFSSFERTFIMLLLACVFFTGNAIVQEGAAFGQAFAAAVQNKYVILPVLFLSVVSSVIAFFCTNYAVTYLEVSRAAVFANIVPVVSVLAGVLILHEPFSVAFVIGIVMILSGVYMVNKVK